MSLRVSANYNNNSNLSFGRLNFSKAIENAKDGVYKTAIRLKDQENQVAAKAGVLTVMELLMPSKSFGEFASRYTAYDVVSWALRSVKNPRYAPSLDTEVTSVLSWGRKLWQAMGLSVTRN